jgi:hypothetical protein
MHGVRGVTHAGLVTPDGVFVANRNPLFSSLNHGSQADHTDDTN